MQFLGNQSDIQSALEPAGRQAAKIEALTTLLLWVVIIVWVVVVVALVAGLIRRRRSEGIGLAPAHRRYAKWSVGIAVGLTVIVLFVLTAASNITSRRISEFGDDEMRTIEVIGHRWWWEVRYLVGEEGPTYAVPTANEIHIPVGVAVRFHLASPDVIHSFWVPRLHGKIDMIPGHVTKLELNAEEEGIYRGQCAEFCGLQHAKMAFLVVAQKPEEFDRWLANQARPARPVAQPMLERGRDVFLASGCPSCHTVRGLTRAAEGKLGPDLTHLASRRTLAAATIPNRRGHLAGWIADPQNVKPGNLMPRFHIAPADFEALLDYLQHLE